MIVLLTILLLIFLACMAFCSAAETALFSLSPLTLKSYQHSNNPRLMLIAHLMKRPRDILVTVLMLIILSSILIQNTVSNLFSAFPSWIFKVGVPLLLMLIFGEVLPKAYAMPNHASVAYLAAPWIARAAWLLSPVRRCLTQITSWISRFFLLFFRKEDEISSDELRHVLRASEATGILLPQECDLISGTLDLQCASVIERMRPRDEIVFYDIHEPLEQLIRLLVDLETTRLPVCNGNLDHVLGILSTRQFFFHRDQINASSDLLPILIKPYYVPETMKSWLLLKNLREKGISLAMVVDEYGSISGLISQEDLVEAVIGEISDRRDEKPLYTRSSSDVIIASGKLELSMFEEIFDLPLPSHEHVATLGGWLIEQLGDIPPAGTKYANDRFLFYVLAADPNRIRRIYVRKLYHARPET